MRVRMIFALIVAGLIALGAANAWADAAEDFKRGKEAFNTGQFEAAMTWYRKAAEAGSAPAQFKLGNAYSEGTGVAQDYAEALKWFHKAADQGYARAQTSLG